MEAQELQKADRKGLRNIKNLFKFDKSDVFWTIFFILLFFSVWAYNKDMRVCRDYAEYQEALWMKMTNGTLQMQNTGHFQWWNNSATQKEIVQRIMDSYSNYSNSSG